MYAYLFVLVIIIVDDKRGIHINAPKGSLANFLSADKNLLLSASVQ